MIYEVHMDSHQRKDDSSLDPLYRNRYMIEANSLQHAVDKAELKHSDMRATGVRERKDIGAVHE